LTRLLPILDDFKRAFDNVPEALEDHRWLDGVRLVKQKLSHLLDMENVTPIEVEVGDEFDPQYHEAVLTQPVEGLEEGQIVAEAQRGYMQGERVLRPARVVVAAPRPQTEDDEEDEESAAEEAGTDATA
jgi:molecular chaperone GrpE